MYFKVNKGLDLPISGQPAQVLDNTVQAKSVAVVADDYVGLKAKLWVTEAERINVGQTLFVDKHSQLKFTSPASGIIRSIERGPKRRLQSIIIDTNDDDKQAPALFEPEDIHKLAPERIKERLITSGLWTAIRTRPFDKVAHPESVPHSIFVSAMDSNPLAADPSVVINEYQQDFLDGMSMLAKIHGSPVYLGKHPGVELPVPNLPTIRIAEFSGPHPAGLVGTHIHLLDPVSAKKLVWHVGYQDVIAIGKLFTSGRLWTERIIALAGPSVKHPRLLRVRLGTEVKNLIANELHPGKHRIISGSVLSGRDISDTPSYLGRYHNQLSVIGVHDQQASNDGYFSRQLTFSINSLLPSAVLKKQNLCFDTAINGHPRAMVPVGNFERVFPFELLPTPLLKALLVGDIDTATALGCLELSEEDLALCTYTCPSKQDYSRALRTCLTMIEAGEA